MNSIGTFLKTFHDPVYFAIGSFGGSINLSIFLKCHHAVSCDKGVLKGNHSNPTGARDSFQLLAMVYLIAGGK